MFFWKLYSINKKWVFKKTINEDPKNLIINIRGRVPMKMEDIEAGIQLGQDIIHGNNLSKTFHL